MTSLLPSNALPVTQIAYAAASITSSYTLAGAFTAPLVYMVIISTLDQPVQISFNGTNDHIAVPIGNTTPAVIPVDFKSNLTIFPAPTIFVKEIGNPTTGSLYVCGFTSVLQ